MFMITLTLGEIQRVKMKESRIEIEVNICRQMRRNQQKRLGKIIRDRQEARRDFLSKEIIGHYFKKKINDEKLNRIQTEKDSFYMEVTSSQRIVVI